MRKLIVIVTLVYVAAVAVLLGYLSQWFRETPFLFDSIVAPLMYAVPVVLVFALWAYRREEILLLWLLLGLVGGSVFVVAQAHHRAYGRWLPELAVGRVESSGTAVLQAHGETLRYRLDLHAPGTIAHREVLVIARDAGEMHVRLPIFGDARSGLVGAKTPADWMVLRATSNPDVIEAETGRFLLVRKAFRIDLRTGAVAPLPVKQEH